MSEQLTLTAKPMRDHVRFSVEYADGSLVSVNMKPRHAQALADMLHKAASKTALTMQMGKEKAK